MRWFTGLGVLLVVACCTVLGAPVLKQELEPHRESTPEILDLEQQLKKQAGEDKKFMPKESNPLPQIDGLADDETKEQQAAALQSMVDAKNNDGGDAIEAGGEDLEDELPMEELEEALEKEREGEEGEEEEEMPVPGEPFVPEAKDEIELDDDVLNEIDQGDMEMPAEEMNTPEEPLDDEVEPAGQKNYDDMFYESLLQSVKDNPDAWEKLLREHHRIQEEEAPAYDEQMLPGMDNNLPMQDDTEDREAEIRAEMQQHLLSQGMGPGAEPVEAWAGGYPDLQGQMGPPQDQDELVDLVERGQDMGHRNPNEAWQYYVGDAVANVVAKKRGYAPPDIYDGVQVHKYNILDDDEQEAAETDRLRRAFVMM